MLCKIVVRQVAEIGKLNQKVVGLRLSLPELLVAQGEIAQLRQQLASLERAFQEFVTKQCSLQGAPSISTIPSASFFLSLSLQPTRNHTLHYWSSGM